MPGVLMSAGPEAVVTSIAGNLGVAAPQVAALADGGYVVVWDTFGRDDPFGLGVFGQRYDASGARLGAAFQVNTTVDLDQAGPRVAATADGGFVVTFGTYFNREATDTPFMIHAQRYDATGARVDGEVLVSETPANDYLGAPVAALADGGYLVAFPVLDADLFGVGLQRIAASGAHVGPTVLANTTQASGSQSVQDLIALKGGGFLVTWTSRDSAGGDFRASDLFGQRLDASGARVGGEFRLNGTSAGAQGDVSLTALENGGFVASWVSDGQDGSFLGVFAQVFSATGARVGSETRVNATTFRNQFDPVVAATPGGGYVVVWTADNNQDGAANGVFAREFDASGVPLSGEVQVNATTAGFQGAADVTALADGRLVISWLSNDGSGAPSVLLHRAFEPGDAAPPPPTGAQTLTAGADTVVALPADQLVLTAPGHLGAGDNLSAGGGLDTLSLTGSGTLDLTAPATFGGFEAVVGANGDDVFLVSQARLSGLASIDGGSGFDTLRLKAAGTLDVAGLALNSVELIAGSSGDDQLLGNAADNVLSGGAGKDLLDGRGGTDTASYAGAGEGVKVTLASTAAQQTGGAGRDTLRGVENLTGSDFNDTLTGAADANVIKGGAGADRLTGGGGADTFVFGALSDSPNFAPDQVTDFRRAQGDRIDLRGIDAVAGGGDDAFTLVSDFTGVAGQLVVVASSGGRFLFMGDVNGDGIADLGAFVTSPTRLSASDFLF